MSIEALKKELSALNADEQRQLTAFLESLHDSRDLAYRKELSAKIDRSSTAFATLREMDRRLRLSHDKDRS